MAVKAVKKYGKGGRMYEKGGKLSFLDKIKGKKDETVAQGAERDDRRADRKAARLERRADRKAARLEKRKDRVSAKAKRIGDRNFKRDVKSGKLKQVGAGMAAGAKALTSKKNKSKAKKK